MKIKIYDRLIKESNESKLKRNRLKLKITSLLTIVAIISLNVSGCKSSKKDTYDVNFTISDAYYKDTNEYVDIDITKNFTEKDRDIINTNVRFDDDNIDRFYNDVSNLSIDYKYSELYDIDEIYKKYNGINKDYKSETNGYLISNNVVSSDYLFNFVKSNNQLFLQNDTVTMYHELDDQIVYLVCKIIAETITEEIQNGNVDYDIGNICENLENLKVLDGAAFSNAFITDDDILVLNISNINLTGRLNDAENQFEMTISHEAIHIIQKSSLKKLEFEGVKREHGFCREFYDVDTNPLYWTWLIEGSAENLSAGIYNCEPSTYRNKISYINSIKISQIFRSDFKINDIERLTEQEDLNTVFEKFELKSDKDKEEFIKMMYSLEIMHQSPDDFIKIYEDKYLNGNQMTNEQKDVINYELKSSICSTITNYFYKNLVISMHTKDYTLGEIFELISLFEQDLNSHLNYDMIEKKEYNSYFFDNYIYIQERFFAELSEKTGLDIEEIKNLYIRYNSELSNTQRYGIITIFNINNLSEEKKLFLSKLRYNKAEYKTSTIIENYESLFNRKVR